MGLDAFSREDLDRAGYAIPGETKNKTVTPYFRYESLLNAPQSEIQKKPIFDLKEVVELRFAANTQYKPVFLVEEPCELDNRGGVQMTWAERFKSQYQAFLAGSEQEAEGTPLEELLVYGMSQAQLSLCRALNIYSIEALAHIEGPGIKKLGVHGNTIKPMAQKYLEDRADGRTQQSEINELKRKIAELTANQMAGMGEEVSLSTSIPINPPILPDGYEDMSDDKLREEIERLAGAKPHHRTSRANLVSMYEQAKAA